MTDYPGDYPSTYRKKMRLLDTFCKAGGATKGYQMAGFEVVGVDKEHMKSEIRCVVLRLRTFSFEQVNGGGVHLDFAPMVGFLGVYATQEDAAKDYPDGPFAQIALGEQKETPCQSD